MSTHLFILSAIFALLGCSLAHSGYDPDADPCTEATGYLHHAEHCSSTVKYLLYYYLIYDLEEHGLGSGSGSGSGSWSGSGDNWFYDYFYEDGEGWDFTDWERHICTSAMDTFDECMHELDQCDNADLVDNLDGYINIYKNTFCDGRTIRKRFQRLQSSLNSEELIAAFSGLTCIDVNYLIDMFFGDTCNFDVDMYESIGTSSFEDIESVLESGFRSSFSCILSNVTFDDCDEGRAIVEPLVFFMYMWTLVPGIDVPFNDIFATFDDAEVNPNAPQRSTVAVFGDPHLYVFGANMDSGEFITCASPGNTQYISNDFIEIYGVNTNVDEEDLQSASYMTSVSITLKNKNGDIMVTYEAGNSELPNDFATQSEDINDAEIELNANGFLLIRSKKAGVAISLANYAHTYQLVLRMADPLFLKSTGLLYGGCSGDDLISRDESVDRRKRNAVCDDLDESSRTACVFDYAATGNASLAAGATSGLTAMTEEAEAQDSLLVDKDGAGALKATMSLAIAMVICAILH